jgi:hypothetical protein
MEDPIDSSSNNKPADTPDVAVIIRAMLRSFFARFSWFSMGIITPGDLAPVYLLFRFPHGSNDARHIDKLAPRI